MINGNNNTILTSIDIGTTKICVLIGRILNNQAIEIIGIGKAPSEGLAKGIVVDIAKTVYAIGSAVKEAELMAGQSIEKAVIGISGSHIEALNSHGVVPIKKSVIRLQDIENALAAASAIPIPQDKQVLHVLPQYFMIDGRELVYDPLGMFGIRLEVEAHIILGALSSVQNLINCCQHSNIIVQDIILEQLASADAVLSYDERMLGAAILDIGGGTTDFAVYHQDSIRYTKVLPVAGNHFTNDLAIGLRTTIKEAERIKKNFGIVHKNYLNNELLIDMLRVQGEGSRTIYHQELLSILQPRAAELLSFIQKEIVQNRLHGYIPAGIVLTGGGSLMKGMQELAESIFELPVRIGNPHITFDLPETLKNPMYATGYGMLVHILKKQRYGKKTGTFENVTAVLDRMKSWIVDLF